MNKTPREVSERVMYLSEEYSKYAGELAILYKQQADYFNSNRVNHKSDTACQRAWDATPEGVLMKTLQLKLKANEKMIGAYKSHLRLLDTEARNLL